MSFNKSAEVLQRVAGGRLNVPVAEDDWFYAASPRNEGMGEYVLVEAILREAIREYQKFAGQRTRRGARLFREVDQWFLDDDAEWDFSFVNVCQILDLEPSYIRTGLKIWWDRNVKEKPVFNAGKPAARREPRRRAGLAVEATLSDKKPKILNVSGLDG
jgi:hypothetical protein